MYDPVYHTFPDEGQVSQCLHCANAVSSCPSVILFLAVCTLPPKFPYRGIRSLSSQMINLGILAHI